MSSVPARFRDRWLLAVDKPSGLATQAPRGGGDNLYDRLRAEHPYLGLHHRLDTPASGLVLFTLSRKVNAAVAAGFREHTIARTYLAVVVGEPEAAGTWDALVDGRPARTRWTVLARADGLSLLQVALETGRTHQVRLHAAGAGHPLVGDRRHGGAAGGLWPRLGLHAWRLALAHPVTGEPLEVVAPPPADLPPLAQACHSA